MWTPLERDFYKSVRRAGRAAGLTVNRIENAVESGWPDVIMRGDGNFHAYAELKIAKGPNGRIHVEPEQINWAEAHHEMHGIVHLLACAERDRSYFWCIHPSVLRRVSKMGCLGEPCYHIRHLPTLILQWTGSYVNLQPTNPPFVEERARLAKAKSRVSISRTAMQILRRDGIRDSRHNRGSYSAESPWGDP